MHDTERTANLLGAAALALTDLMLSSAIRAGEVSASGAAALVVLSTSDGLSVTELGRRVGLSQPAAARMVDGLDARGLVQRRKGIGRTVSVQLTDEGRRAAERLLAGRADPLVDVVGALDESDQVRLAGLLEALLTDLHDQVGSSARICRLCDRAACVADATCPVGAAERARDA